MTQRLLFLQSMWAMERRHTDGVERSIEENLDMIAAAGFDGISAACIDPAWYDRVGAGARARGLAAEWQSFPKAVDDIRPAMEHAAKYGAHHICVQPDVRPRRIEDCIPLLEGWTRLAEQAPCPVLFETHRDRMTTDLFFVLDLLDRLPDLKLLGDLSHFLVGREFAWPVDAENHAMIHRVLDNVWALHGRVASREQVQIEISFPHHAMWLDLFLGWWEYGMRSWRGRAAADATLAFTCELGPQPYAITGRDGNDTTDRWAEALTMRERVAAVWARIAAESGDVRPT